MENYTIISLSLVLKISFKIIAITLMTYLKKPNLYKHLSVKILTITANYTTNQIFVSKFMPYKVLGKLPKDFLP